MVRDLLAGFAPFPWVRQLDVSAFERVNASYVSEVGQQRHDDMVWRLKLGGDWIYVYLLLEFQSHSERWMALRMQVYVGLLLQDLVKRHQLTVQGMLPPVLPLVLYSGDQPWRAAIALSSLMLSPPEGLQDLQPEQKYLLIDQNSYQPGILAEQTNLVAAIFRLQRWRSTEDILDVITKLAAWLKHGKNATLRTSLSHWIVACLKRQRVDADIPMVDDLLEVKAMYNQKFKTFEEEWEYEAVEKGRLQGRLQGRIQGRIEADRERLLFLLNNRFPDVPVAAQQRITAASASELDGWFKRFLRVNTLEELFKPD